MESQTVKKMFISLVISYIILYFIFENFPPDFITDIVKGKHIINRDKLKSIVLMLSCFIALIVLITESRQDVLLL